MDAKDSNDDYFKVPKIKYKEILEPICLQSFQYQSDILSKVLSNLRNKEISGKRMKISSAWLIKNPSAEERFQKRRKLMEKNILISNGFIYLNNIRKVQKIAQSGIIKNGNLQNSQLATSNMGVSICRYSDIFHPGDDRGEVPSKGFLVLVKYLKGNINYVLCDPSPIDPQPQFDCHMVKNQCINKNTTSENAYHRSQIFIYDYTEDGDIVPCQSKIFPFAAIKFEWVGPYLFKMNDQEITSLTIPRSANNTVSDNQKHLSTLAVHESNAFSIIPFRFSFMCSSNFDVKSFAYLYFESAMISLLKADTPWEISAVIENIVFEKEFRSLKLFWANKRCEKSSKDLQPISQDLHVALNRLNILSSTGADNGFKCLNDASNVPQFVTYVKIVLKSAEYSKRLIELFSISKTMGFINRSYKSQSSILIFPDDELSKKLGIPSIPDLYYFHGLVFHSQHPQFQILNNTTEKQKEKEIYFTSLSTIENQSHTSKLEPLLSLEVLRQTLKSQIQVQKKFLLKMVKPQNCDDIISYGRICFNSLCDDYNCLFHNSVKVMKLNETVESINRDSNDASSIELGNKDANIRKPQNGIYRNHEGIFRPLNFLTYCKVGYSDFNGYKMDDFKEPTRMESFFNQRKLPRHMWSLDHNLFQQIVDWHGSSIYE